MKIMIVDDHPEIRGLIRTILAGVASDFVECADGTEALAAYETERPDWTVMDVAMKPMDGLTATRLLTAKHPEAHVMIVTQHHHGALRQSACEAGAVGFFQKEDLIELRSALAASVNSEPNLQSPGEAKLSNALENERGQR
jgi:CheY-like chemotaxis protein